MYKFINATVLQRLADGSFVPVDTNNRDYIEYLKWVSEGNTATPADPPPPPDTRRAELQEALDELIADGTTPARIKKLCEKLKRVL